MHARDKQKSASVSLPGAAGLNTSISEEPQGRQGGRMGPGLTTPRATCGPSPQGPPWPLTYSFPGGLHWRGLWGLNSPRHLWGGCSAAGPLGALPSQSSLGLNPGFYNKARQVQHVHFCLDRPQALPQRMRDLGCRGKKK